MPDSEFQNLIEALPKYDWDLAVKLDGLVSISQVPDSLWDEFIEFYKDYHKPKPTKKERAKNILKIVFQMTAFGVFILVILPWYIQDVYPQFPQEVKDFLEPITAFAVRYRLLIKILILVGLVANTKKQLKNNDSQTLNEALELSGNLQILDEDDGEIEKKVFSHLIEKYQECEAKEYKDIDAYKEVFKTAQSLLENSTNLSDKQRIELFIMKGNIQDDVRGNFEGAIKEYKKAIKIDSEDWTIWYNLAVCYGRKGEADLAISIYKKVIKLNPESGASYYNRAVQYLTKNEFDYACKDFYNAKKLGIDQASIAIEKYCEFKNFLR